MEASVLNVWRPVIYHNRLLDSCQGAIAKLRGGVGHKYRARRAGWGVRHAAAPRNRRWLPYGVSRGGSSVKFKIYHGASSSTWRLTIWAALAHTICTAIYHTMLAFESMGHF
eukprot:COSAG05_NODE_4961_length_1309_cov_3.239669_1_plen_112_part_00